ncbi:MAG: ABC-type transport auxiliary lipoprotein family protein [Alistipes senegalensis]|nr:ABC-type transport auxiliary lipoprotein family protein [Oxalobacter formigenes]MCM1280402.1 ABC-type transport auxiliary lipoprotein family protein [Alistipes senegalensis]
MIKQSRFFLLGLFAALGIFLSGCAFNSQPQAVLYDLGLPSSMPEERLLPAGMPRLLVFQVNAADWLNSSKMYYRLAQVNEQQTRFYTLSRWNTQPPKLFRERLQSRILALGGEIGSGRIADADELRLMVHIEDFSQYFHDADYSEGRIALRVSVTGKNGVFLQKSFLAAVPAPSQDAAGGVRALAAATDGVIVEILQWISGNCRQADAG